MFRAHCPPGWLCRHASSQIFSLWSAMGLADIALDQVDTMAVQVVYLLQGLDSLGDHLHVGFMAEGDDGVQQGTFESSVPMVSTNILSILIWRMPRRCR